RGPWLPGRGRLHGPRKLGNRPRRRRAIRLRAAQRHHDLESDGDPAAGARRSRVITSLGALLRRAPAARLGIASGRDLAQACRDSYSRPTTIALWIICEIAIAACDLAGGIGSGIPPNLAFVF